MNETTSEHPCVTASRINTQAGRSTLTFDPAAVIRTADQHYAYASRADSLRIFEAHAICCTYGSRDSDIAQAREEFSRPDGDPQARRITIELAENAVSVSAYGNINSGFCFSRR